MDKLVPKLYSEYGKYINEFRSFPFILDGCKLVERRLLVSTYEVAKEKHVKSSKIVGHCIGNYHPHGECLTYDTEIILYDNTRRKIGWLAENMKNSIFYVLSMSSNGDIVPAIAHHPRLGKRTNVLCRVHLSNGNTVECTEDHPFIDSYGETIKARELEPGMSLLSLKLADGLSCKVVKVEVIEMNQEIQFYDLTVDYTHNFAIKQGIFVHNSCYDSLVGLVQNGFLDGTQGNWGSHIGINEQPAAAMRYTETKLLKSTLDMMFEYISYIEREVKEFEPEVPFLPTKLPLCLLGKYYTQGIGFGYRTYIPCYTEKDLVKRLEWLLGYTKQEPVIKPITDCDIQSSSDDLRKILTDGKGQLIYKGKYEVDGQSVIIRSWPPTKTWQSIESKFENEVMVDKSIGINDESNGKNGTRIRLVIKRQRGFPVQKIVEKLDKILVGSVTFECNFVNTDGKVVLMSPDNLLLYVYNVYKKVVANVLTINKNDLNKTIDELNIISRMKPILSAELRNNPDNINVVVENISKQLNISQDVVKGILEKYTVGRIFRIKTETKDLQEKKNELEKRLESIDSYVWLSKYNNKEVY